MAITAERDAAIRERNMALEERKRAFAERDMAMLQRDAAISERNAAVQERDDAISALQLRESSMNNLFHDSPGDGVAEEAKDIDYQQQMRDPMADITFSPGDISTNDGLYITEPAMEDVKPLKVRKPRESKPAKSAKPPKGKRKVEGLSKQVNSDASNGWIEESDDEIDKQLGTWKDNLGLNQINFDETSMPVPVCSCTGTPQPCYKWGNGGWQSACCTTTISMYPLPQVSNKRYTRVGGRKMSGSAFGKLLNRLASEGYDLYSAPLDLKDHWAKHGTNRYSTLK